MASLFDCRRRTQTKTSVLLWLLGVNHLPPSSSRTFWGQHHWSGNAGPCVDCTWNISLCLPCRKQFQYFFNSQQRIETWWSRSKRNTICVLFASNDHETPRTKVVIMWTSLTLRQTMRMLTSVSLAFLKKRWNVPKILTFFIWFGESHVTHKNKPSRTISTKNNRSMHSVLSRKRRSRNQATLRFPRSSTRSRSCNASFASIIVIQESYTVYVDVWWRRIRPRIESICHLLSTHSP